LVHLERRTSMRNRIVYVAAGLLVAGIGVLPIVGEPKAPDLLTLSLGVVPFNATGVGQSSQPPNNGLTITNAGSAAVKITGLSITGPDASEFSVSPGYCPIRPAVLSPGQSCSPVLTFTPTVAGTRTATLVIKTSGGAPQFAILAGQGLAPAKLISFSPPILAFGDSPIGLPPQNAPSGYVSVQNSGTEPVDVQSASVTGAHPHDFQILRSGCSSATIPVGGYCQVDIAFVPTATGPRAANLEITGDAAGHKQTLLLTGLGSAAENAVDLFPAAVAFAPIGTTENESLQVTVSNTGSKDVTLTQFHVTGTNPLDFSLVSNSCEPVPYTLAAGTQCNILVLFAPAAVGVRSAVLEVADSATGSPQKVYFEGAGVGASAVLGFNPSPVLFGVQTIGSSYPGYTNLYSSGPGAAPFSLELTGADAGDFSMDRYFCQSPLSPYTNCIVFLSFDPSAAGVRSASVVVTNTANGMTQSVPLVGAGQASGEPLSASYPSFNAEPAGQTSPASGFSVQNSSQSPVTIAGLALSGAAKTDFHILQNGCSAGLAIQPYQSCQVVMTFTPGAGGPKIAEVDIGYSGSPTPLVIPLAGMGLPPLKSIGFYPVAFVSPVQQVGAASTTSESIENTGDEPVVIHGISLVGPDRKDYVITENQCPVPPLRLPPGLACTVSVQFTPSAPGLRLARLQVTDNAGGSPQSLTLTGFGTKGGAYAVLQIDPNALTFSGQPLGSSNTQQIQLSNIATAMPITFSGIKIAGANASDFTLTNNCQYPLQQYNYCYILVNFTPSATGARMAELQIKDDAADSPQIVTLAGLGLKAARSISLSPLPLIFQSDALASPLTATLSLTNTGTESVALTGFHISGPDAGNFGIADNQCPLSPAVLEAGSQPCGITIAFTPSKLGLRIAQFRVTDNAPGGSQSIGMVGQGARPVKTLSLTPAVFNFDPTPVGDTAYDYLPLNITNTGNEPVTLRRFGFDGANPDDFSAFDNYCPGDLSPGSSCQLYFDFTPSATGARSATFVISSDATNSPLKVQFTGTGQ
jgi:hypothetical protein